MCCEHRLRESRCLRSHHASRAPADWSSFLSASRKAAKLRALGAVSARAAARPRVRYRPRAGLCTVIVPLGPRRGCATRSGPSRGSGRHRRRPSSLTVKCGVPPATLQPHLGRRRLRVLGRTRQRFRHDIVGRDLHRIEQPPHGTDFDLHRDRGAAGERPQRRPEGRPRRGLRDGFRGPSRRSSSSTRTWPSATRDSRPRAR